MGTHPKIGAERHEFPKQSKHLPPVEGLHPMNLVVTELSNPDGISVPHFRDAYDWYEKTFMEIDTLSAQRHLMNLCEFKDMWRNREIRKFFVLDDENKVVGMSVLTNNLREWPIVSWRYFEKNFPDEYKRRACWYVGFVGATQAHVFTALVGAMQVYVEESNGIVAMDFSTHNIKQRRLPSVAYLVQLRNNVNTQVVALDSQTTYVYRYDGKGFPTR